MAAHSFLRLGPEMLFACRESYMPEFAAMYRDAEEVTGDPAGPMYSLPAGLLAERLDVLGFTIATCERRLAVAFREAKMYDDEIEAFGTWLDTFNKAMNDPTVEPWDNGIEDVPVWTAWNGDPRPALRLILARVPKDLDVALDISDVVDRGYVPSSATLCADAYRDVHAEAAVFAPRIVMTEGSTDTQFLQSALGLLAPHLAGYVRFLDWDLKPEGSTSALTRAIRAFAAAGISNQVVALFDNDTAAAEALTSLDVTQMPDNFRVVQLPQLALGVQYPTLGPTGPADLDINGLAASIELFFGEDVLRDKDGYLTPVQWTGWSNKLKRYQGELADKSRLQKAFRAKLKAAQGRGLDPAEDWDGMRAVVGALVKAFD